MKDEQIVLWNIQESRERIKKAILKDRVIIFFTRILEDLDRYQNPNFYGRLKEMHRILYPFSSETSPKEIIRCMKQSDFNSCEGISLNKKEAELFSFFVKNLDDKCKLNNITKIKEKIEDVYYEILREYFPSSCKLIEPFLVGKLISSIGGIEKIAKKPSSTIQLIGAEKALFRHMAKGDKSPKHGLIFYSYKIKHSLNRGKDSRELANKLAISLRKDYYRNFPQPLS